MRFVSFALPTRGRSEPCLLDTSAALAFVQPSHAAHATTYAALRGRAKGLAGHAAFEMYSVLTRLAPPDRLSPRAAQRLIEVNFPHSRFLSSKATSALVTQLSSSGVSGSAVYDALVAATAVEHGLGLVSRDTRAAGTYRAMGVDLELLP
jgi:toxin FitB